MKNKKSYTSIQMPVETYRMYRMAPEVIQVIRWIADAVYKDGDAKDGHKLRGIFIKDHEVIASDGWRIHQVLFDPDVTLPDDGCYQIMTIQKDIVTLERKLETAPKFEKIIEDAVNAVLVPESISAVYELKMAATCSLVGSTLMGMSKIARFAKIRIANGPIHFDAFYILDRFTPVVLKLQAWIMVAHADNDNDYPVYLHGITKEQQEMPHGK